MSFIEVAQTEFINIPKSLSLYNQANTLDWFPQIGIGDEDISYFK